MFSFPIRVRYAEVDQQGVVFNAHWLTYFDDAMTRYVETLGFPAKETWLGGHFDVQLVKAVIEWVGSAGFDDEILITVLPTRLGTSSFDLRFTATVADRHCVTCVTTYVTIDPSEGRSRPMPDELRLALESDLAANART
ncbi:MAG: acyl-CoA thioesterase [Actinobacteria bacterium]|nr:acyl-CoA thioesterase [Actinomycetota bacterium]